MVIRVQTFETHTEFVVDSSGVPCLVTVPHAWVDALAAKAVGNRNCTAVQSACRTGADPVRARVYVRAAYPVAGRVKRVRKK